MQLANTLTSESPPFALVQLVGSASVESPPPIRDPLFIAGLTPDRRPQLAPLVTVFEKNREWYRRALTGISAPYPQSLRFLEDQGAWDTPFDHAGMTRPYDIRNWHPVDAAGATARPTTKK
jgi:hypothetical protein